MLTRRAFGFWMSAAALGGIQGFTVVSKQSSAELHIMSSALYSVHHPKTLGAGGMADTRDPEVYVDPSDPRKSIPTAPSFA